ncbi:apolipoprotein N-acyltransferase [Halorhodospira halophila]|uniref:Apolipoprotein N-acyltransferase n=1 Tax=Halorhodospira halophila (strain DSM 244 / SL1) TaxID=349124 RepID=A1WVF3_HALHL|nr:apolipoprotein N-acyltransferase [Halorhodospira halophila]ABM61665.1 apolipoprotein N-acyltransferase [Halorhodospira halophila SL1]MBK1729002.1 apolipoprotein N-acyltransferase [Halorhodospira halophila]
MRTAERLAAGRAGVLAAGLAGGLLPLALAPLGWAVLAVLSPAVLFAVAALAPRRRALQAGYAFGLGQFGVGVSWVFVSINDYGGAGPVLSGGVTVLFVAFLALFPLLAVVLGRGLGRCSGVRLLVTLPAAWVAVEWLRTWLFTGFPWLFVGYAALDTPLAGLAPVIGVLGLSALLVLLAGAAAWLVVAPGWRRAASVAALLVAAVAAGVAADRPWTEAHGEPVRAALLQGNFSQDLKWDPAELQRIQTRYAELTAEHPEADLVIWPETAIPRRFDAVQPYLEQVAEQVRETGGTLVLGIPYQEWAPDGSQLHNSVAVLGEERDVYHKRHLVPYGEYVPFRDLFGRSLDFLGAPMADYSRGPRPEPLAVDNRLRLGATICYEVAYPVAVRRTAGEVDLLVNVSNDAWFGDSLAPHQHLQKARMRAAESGRWMLRATNTGITAVIGPDGEVVERRPQFEVATLATEVERRSGTTPYARIGDGPLLGLLAAALLLPGGLRWYRRRRVGGSAAE